MVSLIRLCRRQGFPCALLDSRLRVVWCSRSAARRWPVLARPDGMGLLFPSLPPLEKGRLHWLRGTFPPGDPSALLIPQKGGWLALFPGEGSDSERSPEEMAALSWQYRQPLGELAGALSLLEARLSALGAEGWEKSCGLAWRSACRLLRGWENLSMVLGGEEPRMVPLDLWGELESLLEAARLALPTLGLDWKLPQRKTVVLADQRQLARIFCNLLANGCLYGGGAVQIRGRVTSGEAVITFRDSGPGFPPESRREGWPRPGASFRREGLPSSGAGLGLCACRRALAGMGGRLILSAGGKGGLAAVVLPRAIGDEPTIPPVPSASYLRERFSPLLVGLSDLILPF